VEVLTQSLNHPTRFFSNIVAITRLHSNAIKEKPDLLTLLTNELKLIGLAYDHSSSQLTLSEGFHPYLSSEPYIIIDPSYLPDQFYKNLIREINWCYSTKAYAATLILIRKLFENLTLDLLRKKFQNDPRKEGLYWKKNNFPRFVILIQNLRDEIQEFVKFSSSINQEVITFLETIRTRGNKSTHTMEDSITKEDIDALKKLVNQYLSLLSSVLQKII